VAQLDSMDALRGMVRERLEEEVGRRADRDLEEQIFRRIIEENQFEAPPSLIEATIHQQMDNIRRQGRQVNSEEFHAAMRPAAEFSVKREYLIHEISHADNIEVSDEDVNGRIELFASQMNQPVDEIRKDFRSREAMSRLQNMILVDKVVDFLKENNEIKVVDD